MSERERDKNKEREMFVCEREREREPNQIIHFFCPLEKNKKILRRVVSITTLKPNVKHPS